MFKSVVCNYYQCQVWKMAQNIFSPTISKDRTKVADARSMFTKKLDVAFPNKDWRFDIL